MKKLECFGLLARGKKPLGDSRSRQREVARCRANRVRKPSALTLPVSRVKSEFCELLEEVTGDGTVLGVDDLV